MTRAHHPDLVEENRSAIGDFEQSGLGAVRFGEPAPIPAPLVRGAEMRVAETRAVNRALRKAYGIGICSVHYRTKGKAFGSLFIENPPRVINYPVGDRPSRARDALSALKLKTSFEQ